MTDIKRTLLLLLLLLLPAPLACVSTPDIDTKITKPFLWRLTRGGEVHHILGTMHIGVDGKRDLDAEVWQIFNAAPCLIVEADQKAVDFGQLYAMSRLPAGQHLKSRLKPEAWALLQSKLKDSAGETLGTSQPWFATLLLLQGLTPVGEPMDFTLVTAATQKHKRIDYLEDWREAISAFAQVTDVTDLEDLLVNEDAARDDTNAMMAAYRSGDLARLETVTNAINARTPGGDSKLEVLLAGRNATWMPRLLKSLAQQDACFVAVGVGHLVGPNNLLTLLQVQGFTAARISRNAK